jgi:hypothetical protein
MKWHSEEANERTRRYEEDSFGSRGLPWAYLETRHREIETRRNDGALLTPGVSIYTYVSLITISFAVSFPFLGKKGQGNESCHCALLVSPDIWGLEIHVYEQYINFTVEQWEIMVPYFTKLLFHRLFLSQNDCERVRWVMSEFLWSLLRESKTQ